MSNYILRGIDNLLDAAESTTAGTVVSIGLSSTAWENVVAVMKKEKLPIHQYDQMPSTVFYRGIRLEKFK